MKKFLTLNISKIIDQSFCQRTQPKTTYPKSTSRRSFKAIKSIFTTALVRHTKLIFSFFNVYFIINNKRTMIARKIILRKCRYLNSLSNAAHPIQIHRAVLEKLRFEKEVKKILTSNISEIYWLIVLSHARTHAHAHAHAHMHTHARTHTHTHTHTSIQTFF